MTTLPDVIKRCNHNAMGCHITYNLTARAEQEVSKQIADKIKRPKYKSYYDACDNPRCQERAKL